MLRNSDGVTYSKPTRAIKDVKPEWDLTAPVLDWPHCNQQPAELWWCREAVRTCCVKVDECRNACCCTSKRGTKFAKGMGTGYFANLIYSVSQFVRWQFMQISSLQRDAMHNRGICCRKMPVCLSVTIRYWINIYGLCQKISHKVSVSWKKYEQAVM